MIDCAYAIRQLWDYLDGELTEERMVAVREHISVCQQCFPHFDFERALLAAVAKTQSRRPAPGELRRRVVAELVKAGMAEV